MSVSTNCALHDTLLEVYFYCIKLSFYEYIGITKNFELERIPKLVRDVPKEH